MAHVSRPLVAVAVVASVLVMAWLLIGQPQPKPPERSKTPFAPIEAVQQAEDVSGASDTANQQRQAAADAVDAP